MSNLTAADYLGLDRLTIHRQIVDLARIHRVTREEAEVELGYAITEGPATGVSFPVFAPPPIHHLMKDPSKPVSYRIRRDGVIGNGKYLAPYGKSYPYVPPCVPPAWYAEPRTPVLFVESQKSALALLRWCIEHCWHCIPMATGGCWSHRGVIGKRSDENGERVDEKGVLDWIVQVAQGRPCYILPDANEHTNPMVRAANENLVRQLHQQRIASEVWIVHLPATEPGKIGWNGFDDFVGTRGDQAVFSLLLSAEGKPVDVHSGQTLVCVPFSEIQSKPVKWLWPERLVRGYINVFSGNPDEGKSTVAIDLIARYTRGLDWPDGARNTLEPGNVLVLIAEDGAEDVYKPRLEAAGADMVKVFLMKGIGASKEAERMFALDEDLSMLEIKLKEHREIGLIVVDPASSYLRANMDKEREVRRVLGPIKEMCEHLDVTVLFVGHFNKRSDVGALQRVAGAVANTGLPRSVWMFMKAPNGELGDKLMLLGKGNFAKKRTGMRYRFRSVVVKCDNQEMTDVPVIEWQGEETELDAQSVTDASRNPMGKAGGNAERFLRKHLADGERPSQEVLGTARKESLARNNLFATKKKLGFKAFRKAGIWWWPGVREWHKRDESQSQSNLNSDAPSG